MGSLPMAARCVWEDAHSVVGPRELPRSGNTDDELVVVGQPIPLAAARDTAAPSKGRRLTQVEPGPVKIGGEQCRSR